MNTILALDDLKKQAARYFDRPGLTQPAFLDDTTIAVLDDRTGVPQIALLNPVTCDVQPVTGFRERIQTLLATSTGSIVFGMDAGGNERQQVWKLDLATLSSRQVTLREDAIHQPGAVANDGALVLASSNARDDSVFDIVGIDLESGESAIWLDNAGVATPVAITRDANQALVIRNTTNLDADLWLVSRDGGTPHNLTAHQGEAWILDAAFGPDEKSVWILTNRDRDYVYLARRDLETDDIEIVVERNWDIEAFSLSPDASHIAYSLNEAGVSRVFIRCLNKPNSETQLRELDEGVVDRFSWSPDGSCVAFGFSTAEKPSQIVIADTSGSIRKSAGEVASPQTSQPMRIAYASFDGLEISGFLFLPTGDGPHPVLIEIHGGPESQRRPQYASAVPMNQFVCSLGIAVLSLNVRGSTGFGKRFTHLDDRELRLDAVRDVAAAVAWLRTRDDVIPDRIGVMGQSYGGFMTLAAIGLYPDLWAVAVDVVGIANFVSFLERTGPWRRSHRSHEYGFLEHDLELLQQISPINYVDAISAPLLVIHGRNDPRVPLFEAEQIVAALEQRGRSVSLRVFDDEGHGLSKRQNRIDGYAEAAAFLAQRLLNPA